MKNLHKIAYFLAFFAACFLLEGAGLFFATARFLLAIFATFCPLLLALGLMLGRRAVLICFALCKEK